VSWRRAVHASTVTVVKDEPRSPVPLLQVAHEDGVAAVCRDEDDGSLWLTAELGSDEWWDLEGYEVADEDSDSVRAFAGRLPSGAASAELRDVRDAVHSATIGSGVWLVVVPRSVPVEPTAVLFRDPTGAIVAPAQPPSADAEPIPDADVPCPACQGREWDLVTRPERESSQPEQMIVCRRCGHEALAYFGPRPPKPEIPPELEEPLQKAGQFLGGIAKFAVGKWQDYALEVDFPVYGLGPSWMGARSLAGFSTSGLGRAYSVELLHRDTEVQTAPAVLVETMREEDERQTVDELVLAMLERGLETLDARSDHEPLPSALSDPARQLIEHLRELSGENERARRAAVAGQRKTTVNVDDKTIEFLVAEGEGLSAAAAAIGELDISLLTKAVSIDDLALCKVELSDYKNDTGPAGA
jgi:hypothetical protein